MLGAPSKGELVAEVVGVWAVLLRDCGLASVQVGATMRSKNQPVMQRKRREMFEGCGAARAD